MDSAAVAAPPTDLDDPLFSHGDESVGWYRLTYRLDSRSYAWFNEWHDELLALYTQIEEWCKRIGWDLTDRMNFYTFCAMVAKMSKLTDDNQRRRGRLPAPPK